MPRKGLLSLLGILLVLVMAVGLMGTGAWYTDVAPMTDVDFTTGNADLQLTQCWMHNWMNSGTSADLGVDWPQDLYPGYQGSWGNPDGCIYLGNWSASPIDLVVTARIANYSETVGGLKDKIQLAMAWGGTCDPGGVGTGFHTLRWWKNNAPTLFTGADPSCGYIPNDHTGGYSGYARSLKFYLYIPGSVGNEIANAQCTFDIVFDAVQKH